jgi:3' exoribonuclease, RNase T-like
MRVFIDTEFTDFLDCDLISIGLVAADGREFYGERSDYDDATCSPFVREAVLPQLGQHPGRVFTREALRTALLAWLDQFAREPERFFCMDNATDWDLLADLLDGVPPGWQGQLIGTLIDYHRLETYFAEHKGRHHALGDARAQRYALALA